MLPIATVRIAPCIAYEAKSCRREDGEKAGDEHQGKTKAFFKLFLIFNAACACALTTRAIQPHLKLWHTRFYLHMFCLNFQVDKR